MSLTLHKTGLQKKKFKHAWSIASRLLGQLFCNSTQARTYTDNWFHASPFTKDINSSLLKFERESYSEKQEHSWNQFLHLYSEPKSLFNYDGSFARRTDGGCQSQVPLAVPDFVTSSPFLSFVRESKSLKKPVC